jgi:hypothetical protein
LVEQGKTTLARRAASGWKRAFDDPIPLPSSRKLVTLLDAATYATKLPKKEVDTAEWQGAISARCRAAPQRESAAMKNKLCVRSTDALKSSH